MLGGKGEDDEKTASIEKARKQYMMRGNVIFRIPDLYQGDMSESLLVRILKQAHINKAEWEKL
jgi:hypothetical protein